MRPEKLTGSRKILVIQLGALTAPEAKPITELLLAWGQGDDAARDRLISLVYSELRRRASAKLKGERHGHTLQPTALVHEAYLRLVDQKRMQWQNRAHFFAVAAEMMRRILVDHARGTTGGASAAAARSASRSTRARPPAAGALDLGALDEALAGLAALDPRQGRIVELRYFGGLSIEETAEVLGISPATVKREWTVARAWLHRELSR